MIALSGEQVLGEDTQQASAGREDRHRVLGGLDTSAAALDARQRRNPTRIPRISVNPTSALRRHPAQGARLRRGKGAHRMPPAARRRRHRRHPVRGVPHFHRRGDLLQHHAARPRRHRHDARGCHARGRSTSGATAAPTRATTSSASTATGCSRTRRCASRGSISALSTSSGAQRDVGVPVEGGLRLPDERRESVFDRLQHPGRHPRSEGPRVSEQEHGGRHADHGRRVLARGCR